MAVYAQSNLRTKKIAAESDTIVLDTLSIAPGSLSVDGMDTSQYVIDYPSSKLIFRHSPSSDSITVSYRVWPVNLTKTVYHKDPSLIAPGASVTKNPFTYTGKPLATESFSMGGLDKSGSISRGVLFGNNQNLGVNSNLNLQLSGPISENIKIEAVISDKNIPVQPEGNTQQLQDFDQVYVKLYTDNLSLTAGDFQLTQNESHFMKYNKRLRGGTFSGTFDLKKGNPGAGSNTVSASGALSRGKFSRNVFNGNEGNQGPYRLVGAEGEQFIIILSGTERVYIDGKLLTRGQVNDYVIDYNKAEITFTAKQPITKDKRIVVEFQYSALAYSRSLFQVADYLSLPKLDLNVNFYSEQDNKNRPLFQDLRPEDIALLQNIGDDLNKAYSNSVQKVEYVNDRVLYRQLIDSLTGDTIYEYSTNPDSAHYQISFNNVGPGKGNYVEIPATANGRVFKYVPPINGVPQGNYEPIVLLVTPKSKRMLTLGGEYRLSANTNIRFEGALSFADINTFSDKDNTDNTGYAFMVETESKKKLGKSETSWFLTGGLNYEQRADNFAIIERYRSVEFDRNWNIRDQKITGNQYLPGAHIGLEKNGVGRFRYDFKSFISGESYEGYRNSILAKLDYKGFFLDLTGSLLNTRGTLSKTDFSRHKVLFKKQFKPLSVGFRDDFEHNLRRSPVGDTLLDNSYSFWEWEVFVTNNDTAKTTFKVGYIYRIDNRAEEGGLQGATLGQSIVGELGLLKNPRSQLRFRSQYRSLEVLNDSLYQGREEQTLTNRIDYTLRLFKGAVTVSSFYEVGSGLEEEKSFVYVKVPAGTGVYTWVDYNGNGIAEQDEFEVAAFPDQADYVRVLTPTNNYVRIYRTQFNQTLMIQPRVVWASKKGIRKVMAMFSDQLAYRIDRKSNNNVPEEWLNPFSTSVLDENILSLTSSFRNTLYFNRTSPVWSMEYTYQTANSKFLQTNGLQAQDNLSHLVNFRYNLTRVYQLNLEGKTGRKRSGAENFTSRNYAISSTSFKPSITFLQGAGFKLILSYIWEEKKNSDQFGGEFISSQNVTAELQLNKVGKGTIVIKGSFVTNKFTGENNSAVAYEMLQGLNKGKNGLWQVTFQRTIARYLQLNLRYDGRVSEGQNVIHTGSVEVRAFF